MKGALRRRWVLLLTLGVSLQLLGVTAILVPVITTVAVTLVIGCLLLGSGVVALCATFRARADPDFGCSLMSAVLEVIAGIVLLCWPWEGTLSLTVVVIASVLIEGVAAILHALEHRERLPGRGRRLLANGILDLVLGTVLYVGLPGTALWALGLLLGIYLILRSWAVISMALFARGAARSVGIAPTRI